MENKREIVVFIAGAYSARTKRMRESNVKKASRVGAQLMSKGFSVYVPHFNSHYIRPIFKKVTERHSMDNSLRVLERCDAVLMLPGWEKSLGAKTEREKAIERKIPVFEKTEDLEAWAEKYDPKRKIKETLNKVKEKERHSSAEVIFFSLIGFILSVLAGVYVGFGNYLVALVLLNLLLLEIVLISIKR